MIASQNVDNFDDFRVYHKMCNILTHICASQLEDNFEDIIACYKQNVE